MKLYTKEGNMIFFLLLHIIFYIPVVKRHQSLDQLDDGTHWARTEYFQSTLPERKPVCSSYFNIHLTKSELCPKYLGWVESEMDGHRQFIYSQIYTGAAGKTCCVCPTFVTCWLTGLFSIQAAQGSRNTFAHINRVAVITQKQPRDSLCHSVTTEMRALPHHC